MVRILSGSDKISDGIYSAYFKYLYVHVDAAPAPTRTEAAPQYWILVYKTKTNLDIVRVPWAHYQQETPAHG
jgi:hypothetical protein